MYGRRKNGEEFPGEASISKVTVGDATFFSVVLRDITRRKNAEEALQRAVAARDDVLGIVAHDLRNPLSAIMMQASMMRRPGPEPDRRDPEPREMIARSAKRMNQLIQDFLDVALVEAGQLKVEPVKLSSAELAREAVSTQESLATASDIELRLEVADDVRHCWGDHRRLLQVFQNLIGNAIKFTESGGRIVVRVAREDKTICSPLPTLAPVFRQIRCRTSSTGSGKRRREPAASAPGSGWRSARASSKRTVGGFGSRASSDEGPRSSLRFLRFQARGNELATKGDSDGGGGTAGVTRALHG